MATTDSDADGAEQYGFRGSLARSFLTQYWPFTAYVLSYATFGAGLGAVTGAWNWTVYGLLVAGLWFGLEGLHAIDLAEDDIATRIDSRVQAAAGAVGLGIGAGLGFLVAWQTTWWFLPIVLVEVFLGLAYNKEWFGGLLHDFDTLSGLTNFGVSWGALPFLAGFVAFGGTIGGGVLIIAIAIALDAMELIALFEVSKPAPYDDLNIAHDRDIDQTTALKNEVVHRGNKMAMLSWAALALGTCVYLLV